MNTQYLINWSIGLLFLLIFIIGFYIFIRLMKREEDKVRLQKARGQWDK